MRAFFSRPLVYSLTVFIVLCVVSFGWYAYRSGCFGAARYTMYEDKHSEVYRRPPSCILGFDELRIFAKQAGWLDTEVKSRIPVAYGDAFHPRQGALFEYPDFKLLFLGTTDTFSFLGAGVAGNYGNFAYHFKVYGKTGETGAVSYTIGLPGWQKYFIVDDEPFMIYNVLGTGGLAVNKPAPFTECNAGPCRAD